MRRLYLQVYLAFVGVLLVFAALLALAWRLAPSSDRDERMLAGVAAVVAELLPADRPPPELAGSLRRIAAPLGVQLTLWNAQGVPLASAGAPLAFPGGRVRSGWVRSRGGPTAVLRLPDGRWLAARHPHSARMHGIGLAVSMALLALAVAVGAYPLARRITRRLERLRTAVEDLGGGDLRARVPVEGRDEVASLARSFNKAADRIEALVGAQRAMLAGASHELRSPLTRIRMATELLAAERPELKEQTARDVAELDELIGELLLASRLQTVEELEHTEELDLLGLVAEEAARYGAEAGGMAASVRGDTRLLRRLVRNLIENAHRHGGGSPVEASVDAGAGRVRLRVCDRGPGVPPADEDRIFAPFYRGEGEGAGGGAGLGLSLVRQIARRHGGDVRYLAREGGGSCFEVDLPGCASSTSPTA